jgi:hypothetical protein
MFTIKSTLEQAMKAERRSRGIVLLFFNLNARRRLDSQRHAPHRSAPGKEKRYPLYSRLGGSQSRSGRVRKIFPSLPPAPPAFGSRIAHLEARRLYKNVLKNIYLRKELVIIRGQLIKNG